MSKASEWARRKEEAEAVIRARPEYQVATRHGRPDLFVRPAGDGGCEIGFGGTSVQVESSEVVAFASWLIATFGDEATGALGASG